MPVRRTTTRGIDTNPPELQKTCCRALPPQSRQGGSCLAAGAKTLGHVRKCSTGAPRQSNAKARRRAEELGNDSQVAVHDKTLSRASQRLGLAKEERVKSPRGSVAIDEA